VRVVGTYTYTPNSFTRHEMSVKGPGGKVEKLPPEKK
jgi:hypothetical protein